MNKRIRFLVLCSVLAFGFGCIASLAWRFALSVWQDCFLECQANWGPFVWSPEGTHLVFGVTHNYDLPRRFFVVDANGRNFHELMNLDKQNEITQPIDGVGWDPHTGGIYFNSDHVSYLVPIEGGTPQPISFTAAPAIQWVTGTPCNASSDKRYTTSQQGFAAQSVCTGNISSWYGCGEEKLQICNTTTDQVTFELTYGDILKKDHPTAAAAFKKFSYGSFSLGLALLVGTLVTITGKELWRESRKRPPKKKKKRTPKESL
jgi:hypothetical protein